jgi:hypothetical protein
MEKVKLSFEISKPAFDLLNKISKDVQAEYRDTEFGTLEDFKNSSLFQEGRRTEEWFLNRNYFGTYHLIDELSNCGLVEVNTDAWHVTFIVSEFGKQILDNQ